MDSFSQLVELLFLCDVTDKPRITFCFIGEKCPKLDSERKSKHVEHMLLKRVILWYAMLCYPLQCYGMECMV